MNNMLNRSSVIEQLTQVIDPELGVAITELDLIEEITVNDGEVGIQYHLTSNFCPPQFAIAIATDIKTRVEKLDEVKKVKQNVTGHFLADEINSRINGEKQPE